jgi:hypothetical protein
VNFVRLQAAKEVKLPHPEANGIFEHRKHQLGPWTEIGKFRIEALQVAKDGIAVEEALDNCKCAALGPQAIQAQSSASEQSWSECPMELSYTIIMENPGLPCSRPPGGVQTEQIIQKLRQRFGGCELNLRSSCSV